MKLEFLVFLLVFGLSSQTKDHDYQCGKRATRQGHHLGGPRMVHGAFPWNAALVTLDGEFICSGILISRMEIVTAAHCIHSKESLHIFNPNDLKVLLGYHNLTQQNEIERTVALVSKIRIHPDWMPHISSYDADIAVLELEQEITFSNYIQPICLVEPGSEIAKITSGAVVGFAVSNNGNIENIPRIVDISSFISYKDCTENNTFSYLFSHRTFCGEHSEGTSLSSGDDGSSLIIAHQNTYYLRGIVMALHSNILVDSHDYTIFTDVTKFYGWLTNSEFSDCNDAKLLKYVKELEKENRELKEKLDIS